MYLFRSYASASFMSLSGNMGRNVFTSLSLRRENRAPASFSVNCRRISRSVSMWVIRLMLIGMNVRNIRSFRLPFCRLEAERRPHREAGILVSRMFPALLLILFVLKQIADLGQQLHVGGGAAGAGASSFFFSCNLLNRRISRKIENEIIRKSSVVCRKLP